ncbi:hypothetical protein GNF86_24200 [Clostridium perfringens]
MLFAENEQVFQIMSRRDSGPHYYLFGIAGGFYIQTGTFVLLDHPRAADAFRILLLPAQAAG